MGYNCKLGRRPRPRHSAPWITFQRGKLGRVHGACSLYLKGHGYSVRDIIKHASDAAGGVHRTNSPKGAAQKIAEFSAGFGIGGLPAAIRQLKAIARVALRGLRRLIAAAQK